MAEGHSAPPLPSPTATPLRGETQDLYVALLLLGHWKKANNLLECGHSYYAAECWDCGTLSRINLSCHLRLCARCARRLADSFIARHWTALQKMTQPKLLTLTFQSTETLTPATITYCIKSFATLRHRKLWKHNVSGGLAGLELTWGPPGWHPHLHCLIDSNYIPRPKLIAAWKKITHGAWHVDIRQIDAHAGVMEVAKYIGKGFTFYKQKHLLHQFLDATHKRRFFSSFGSLYRASDPEPPPDPVPLTYDTAGPVNELEFGLSFIHRCHQCGSRHLKNLGKLYDIEIVRPTFQIPF